MRRNALNLVCHVYGIFHILMFLVERKIWIITRLHGQTYRQGDSFNIPEGISKKNVMQKHIGTDYEIKIIKMLYS